MVNGQEVTKYIPIGIKPQNLNFNYPYNVGMRNQLSLWIQVGYLNPNFTFPTVENTAIDYRDVSKSLQQRVRSYVDINCAHCHTDDRHCDYRPMRFAFNETGLGNGVGNTNLGVCVNTQDMQGFPSDLEKIITPGSPERSMLFYRINTTNETFRMPLHGRTMLHDEGIALIEQWINSLQDCP
jgi:mono/diheme cytochrome c family protein